MAIQRKADMVRPRTLLWIPLLLLSCTGLWSAPGAGASNITATKYPAVLTGTQTGKKDGEFIRLSIGAGGTRYVECGGFNIEGTLEKAVATVKTVTTYGNCFVQGSTGIPATVQQNGCSHTLEATSTASGQTTIDCPEGKRIEVSLFENSTRHAENVPFCKFAIPAQGPLSSGSIEASNAGTNTEDLLINLDMTGVKTVGVIGTLISCGIAAGKEGTSTLRGIVTVTGETDNVNKEHVPVMIE